MPTTRSRTPRADRGRGARGVTLLELIVVMTILSVLFGVGVGAFRRLARPEQLALSRMKQAIRSAALFARGEGAPATVEVAPGENALRALGLRTVGNWHFEDDEGTGWPVPAVYEPGNLVPDGVVGSALRLTGADEFSIARPPPSFDSPYGFGVDVSVRPEPSPRPMTLLERRGLWALGFDQDDRLVLTLQLEVQNEDGSTGVQEVRHELPDARLPADRFSRLSVLFDGRSASVSVDGARVGDDLVFDRVRRLASNPTIALSSGVPPTQLRGALDELRVLSVIAGEPAELPEEVVLEGPSRLLHLDGAGRLDPAWHRTPFTVSISHGEPLRVSTVEVGLLGTVRSFEEQGPAADARLEQERAAADAERVAAERERTR